MISIFPRLIWRLTTVGVYRNAFGQFKRQQVGELYREHACARSVCLSVSSRQLQVQECSSDEDDHHDYNLLHNSTRRILSSSSTTTTTTTNSNELRSSRNTAAACIAAAVTASLYDESNAMEISRHSTTIVESSDDSDDEEDDDDEDEEEEEEETSANILFCPAPSSASLSNTNAMLADQVKQESLVQPNTNQFRPIPQPIPVPPRPVTYPPSYLNQQQYHPSHLHQQQPSTAPTALPSSYPRQFLSSRRNPYPTLNSSNSACSCSHRTPSTSTVITPSNGSNGAAATSMSPFILYPPNQTSNVIPTLAATTQQTVALAAAAASAGKSHLIHFWFASLSSPSSF